MGTGVNNASVDGPSHTLTSRRLESTLKGRGGGLRGDAALGSRSSTYGLEGVLKQQQKRAGGIIKHNTNAVKGLTATQAFPGDNVDEGNSPEPPPKKAMQPAKPAARVPARGRDGDGSMAGGGAFSLRTQESGLKCERHRVRLSHICFMGGWAPNSDVVRQRGFPAAQLGDEAGTMAAAGTTSRGLTASRCTGGCQWRRTGAAGPRPAPVPPVVRRSSPASWRGGRRGCAASAGAEESDESDLTLINSEELADGAVMFCFGTEEEAELHTPAQAPADSAAAATPTAAFSATATAKESEHTSSSAAKEAPTASGALQGKPQVTPASSPAKAMPVHKAAMGTKKAPAAKTRKAATVAETPKAAARAGSKAAEESACDLDDHTVLQLRAMAKGAGLSKYSKLRKAELIELIKANR
eukprot:jgi/Tetstr1/422672/TSEL_013470.t1